jgi:uncharacterized protein YeaO (DUF488 family)
MIEVKRVYDPPNSADGARYLVDRLWPRGLSKRSLKIEAWLKDVAPTNELRHWYSHDPAKWDEFRRRYFADLDSNPESWAPLLTAARKGRVTLLFSSREPKLNNAFALKEYLESKLSKKTKSSASTRQ